MILRWQPTPGPGMAHDFFTLAISGGRMDRRWGDTAGVLTGGRPWKGGEVHPSTGILMVEYPLSWLGARNYQVQEIGRDRLPPRFATARATDIVRVLHTPEQLARPEFLRGAYCAPCVQPIVGPNGIPSHPVAVHSRYAPVEICGMLGTSHYLRDTPLGPVPVVPAGIYTARAQDAIHGGKDASSLSYAFDLLWAEQAGDQKLGDTIFRAYKDYDVIHIMGAVNHMIVGCSAGEARGKDAARLIFDCATRPEMCYAPIMQLQVTPKVKAALAAAGFAPAKANDLVIDLGENPPTTIPEFLRVLLASYEASLGEQANMAATMAQQETVIGEQSDALAQADDLLFKAQQVEVREAIKMAGRLGVQVKAKHADDLGPPDASKRRHPVVVNTDGAATAADVRRLWWTSKTGGKNPAAMDTLTSETSRDGYITAMWDTAVAKLNGPASGANDLDGGGDGSLVRIKDPAKFAETFRRHTQGGRTPEAKPSK